MNESCECEERKKEKRRAKKCGKKRLLHWMRLVGEPKKRKKNTCIHSYKMEKIFL
mgnify:CR=1 FL=1